MLLSGLLRSYNEESNMARCLQCLFEFCDEVVISDGGSTDRTEEIARGFGSKVVWLDFKGRNVAASGHWDHTADQLNFALSHCQGEWIILQDVDQTYCDRVKKHLRGELITTDNNAFSMFGIHFLGDDQHYIKELSVGPSTVRLWRNSPTIRFRGALHTSHLSYLAWGKKGGIFRGSRFHYGYISTEVEMNKAKERHMSFPDDAAYAQIVRNPPQRTPVLIPWWRCDPDCITCWMEEI
ncbi:MAG: glycosyltransferase [Candidatus Thorarchaeota archaeon]